MSIESFTDTVRPTPTPRDHGYDSFAAMEDQLITSKCVERVFTTERELVLEPCTYFKLPGRPGKKPSRIFVPQTFGASRDRYPAGTELWMRAESSPGGCSPRLYQIMERDIHDVIVAQAGTEDADEELWKFLHWSPAVRREVLRRRVPCPDQRADVRAPELTPESFRTVYWLTRTGYTLEQRDRIERIMPKYDSSIRGKVELQLDYIFNISETYGRPVTLGYDEIMAAFDRRIYGQTAQKRRIAELLAHRSLAGDRGVKILLVGGEGTGKSRFREVIRDLVQLPSAVIELGGESNPCALIGHNASYYDADAGDILKTFRKLRTTEALIGWVDIDKTEDARDGAAINALKGIVSEDCHVDKFTLYPLSTRHTIHIAEATGDEGLPGFVKAAFEIVRLDPYTEEDKVAIARAYTVPELCRQTAVSEALLRRPPEESALRFMARNFSGGDGMKEMAACCATVVKRLVQEETAGRPLPFDEAVVRGILGDSPDRSDPMIRYNLARGRYTPEIENAIRDARRRLRNEKLSQEERTVESLRLGYLVDMAETPPAETPFDREAFLAAVDGTHWGLQKVKGLLADHFGAQNARGGSLAGLRLLLEGPAGVGKTSLIASVAKALGAAYVRVPLNNVSDVSTLKGLYRTYAHADAGVIVKGVAQARRRMPETSFLLVHLDEVDKLSPAYSEVLIDLLDDSGLFLDYFLGAPVKFTNVLFCGTANDVSRIPAVILDRFRVIHMDGYTGEEKARILRDHLLPAKEREYRASRLVFTMDDRARDLLLGRYCPNAGVRDLKQAVDRVTEYAVSHRGPRRELVLDAALLRSALGEAPMERGNLPGRWLPGCAKALSVSEGGAGSCFAVESVVLPGEKGLTVTGLAGESTVDSVKIALTYLKSRYDCARGPLDVHLSFGEGAVRKDGPSAGVAILVSLLSAMIGRAADPEAAYTGEIDLLGNVYPVGGVLRKLQAAARTGCRRVFVPAENLRRLDRQELAALPLEVVPVVHVEEVIPAVFAAESQALTA